MSQAVVGSCCLRHDGWGDPLQVWQASALVKPLFLKLRNASRKTGSP